MQHKSAMYRIGAAAGLLILILDNRTALSGMHHGLDICINTLIPSIFPFMVLSNILTGNVSGTQGLIMEKLGRFCKVPQGSEMLLLTGFLGGYPVGAQNAAQLYRDGLISREDAHRMCIFCNNAGPSFLFCILLPIFSDFETVLLLWVIQMFSAILLGHFYPGGAHRSTIIRTEHSRTVADSLSMSIHAMAKVCGWVLVFRMLLEFLENWFLWLLPSELQVLVTGVLELSNGCLSLAGVQNESIRFFIASVLLSFGGICICMQTFSVCPKEIQKGYCTGKILHSVLSAVLSLLAMSMKRFLPVRYVLMILFLAGIILVSSAGNPGIKKKEVAF